MENGIAVALDSDGRKQVRDAVMDLNDLNEKPKNK